MGAGRKVRRLAKREVASGPESEKAMRILLTERTPKEKKEKRQITNVEATLRVVDTQTNSAKTYVNPLGAAFQPVQDTSAFATCP